MFKETNAYKLSKLQFFWMLTVPAIMSEFVYIILEYRSIYNKEMLENFGISNTQLGVLFSAYGIAAMVCYAFGGLVADRFRMKFLMPVSIIIIGGTCFVMAMNPSYPVLFAMFLIVGADSAALYWSTRFKIVRLATKEDYKYAGNVGLSYLIQSIIGFIMSYVFLWLLNTGLGFNAVLNVSGVICVVMGVLIFFTVPYFEGEINTGSSKKEETAVKEKGSSLKNYIYCFKQPCVWITVIVIFCTYAINSYVYLYVDMLKTVFLAPLTLTATIGTIRSYAIGWFSTPLAGAIQTKTKTTLGYVKVAGIVCTFSLVGFMLIGQNAKLIIPYAILLCVVSFFAGSAYKTGSGVLAEFILPKEYYGTATSVFSTFAYASDAFFPIIIGRVMDKMGNGAYSVFTIAFLVMAAMLWLAGIWGKQVKKRDAEKIAAATAAAAEEAAAQSQQ